MVLVAVMWGCTPVDTSQIPGGDDATEEPTPPEPPPPLPDIAEACAGPISDVFGWQGPVSDAHVHAECFDPADVDELQNWALQLLHEMNATGTQQVIVSGDPMVSGWSQEEAIERERGLAELWIPIMESCDRLRYQLSGFDPADPASVQYIEEQLDAAPFVGVGTIDMRNVDGPVAIDGPGLRPVFELLAERGLPFQLHSQDAPPGFQDAFMAILGQYPEVHFIQFGGGFEVDSAPNNLTGALVASEVPLEAFASGHLSEMPLVVGSDIGPDGITCAMAPASHYQSFEAAITDIRLKLDVMGENEARKLAIDRFSELFGTYQGGWPPDPD